MRPFTLRTAVATIGLLLLLPSVAAARPGWHTRAQAERNILNAPRALRNWAPGLVNPKTLVVRQNVSVICRGLDSSHPSARFSRFSCTVTYRSLRVRMLYVAQTANGFELRGRAQHP
jgi:hypothetical protein